MKLLREEKYPAANETWRFEIWEDDKGRIIKVFQVTPNGDSLVETYPLPGFNESATEITQKIKASINTYPKVKERTP